MKKEGQDFLKTSKFCQTYNIKLIEKRETHCVEHEEKLELLKQEAMCSVRNSMTWWLQQIKRTHEAKDRMQGLMICANSPFSLLKTNYDTGSLHYTAYKRIKHCFWATNTLGA